MPSKSSKAKSYRSLTAELDEVMNRLQDPELDIDEASQLYEAGLQLIKQLEAHLEQAENTIQVVRAKFDDSPAGQ